MTPIEALRSGELSPREYTLLHIIIDLLTERPDRAFTIGELSVLAQVEKRTIHRHLNELTKQGWISTERITATKTLTIMLTFSLTHIATTSLTKTLTRPQKKRSQRIDNQSVTSLNNADTHSDTIADNNAASKEQSRNIIYSIDNSNSNTNSIEDSNNKLKKQEKNDEFIHNKKAVVIAHPTAIAAWDVVLQRELGYGVTQAWSSDKGKEAKALQGILKKLNKLLMDGGTDYKTLTEEKKAETLSQSFQVFLSRWDKFPDFYKKTSLSLILGGFDIIYQHLKNGKSTAKPSTQSTLDELKQRFGNL